MDSPSSDYSEANENAAGLTDDILAASQQYEDSIGGVHHTPMTMSTQFHQ